MSRYGPLTGLAFAVLFALGSGLWFFDAPETVGEPDEIARFYIDHSGAVIAGTTLAMLSMVFLAVFAAVVYRLLVRADGAGGWLPAVALVGAAVLIGAGLVAEGVNGAAAFRADEDGTISGQAAQIYFDISQMMGFPAGGVGAALFIGAVALVALRTGEVLPRPLALLSVLLALVCVTPIAFAGIALLPVWAAVVSLVLWARTRGIPKEPSTTLRGV